MNESPENAIRSWRTLAWFAAVFTLLVGVGMIAAQLRHKASDPWRSPALLALKAQLVSEPRNDELKQQIRELDLGLRRRYFRLLDLKATGVYLLFGGALVLLYSGTKVRRLNKLPPMPQPDPGASARLERRARRARNAVAVCGVVVLAAVAVLAFGISRSPLEDSTILAELVNHPSPAAAPAYTVSAAELHANWPGFRGSGGSGIAADGVTLAGAPEVVWQVPTPASGFNSLLVWKDQVFFTGGDAGKREVFCLEAATGDLEWRQPAIAPAPAGNALEVPEMTGYAASTAATDGERVYAIFATGELVAFSLNGGSLWAKQLGPLDNPYGHASSLVCWQDRVVVQLDQGGEDSRRSRIIEFDGRTGEVIWQKARLVGASWSTPIVIEATDPVQVIALGLPWVIAYDVSDGTELWRAELLEGEITPSPVFAGGRLILVDPGMYQLLALRTDGRGDVSAKAPVWRVDGDMPDITSPVCTGEWVFTLTTDGTLSCFNAESGEEVWMQSIEVGGEIQASPSLVGDVLLVVSTAGDLIGLRAGGEYGELWRSQLDDEFYASPAFANGRVYLRGNKQIWCLAEPGKDIARP